MLAVQQQRAVGAVRRAGSVMPVLPVRASPLRKLAGLRQEQSARIAVTRAYDNGGNNGYDNTETQQKLDELTAKVQKWWDQIDDKATFFLYVGVSVFGVTVANQFLRAVDSLPLFPTLLKLVGLVYSSWFTYKYLLFASGREQLGKDFKKIKDGIAGSVPKEASAPKVDKDGIAGSVPKEASAPKVDKDLKEAVSSLKSKVADTQTDFKKAAKL